MRVTASGRTDAGVHALGQVVSFVSDSALADRSAAAALNAELPRDMAVLERRGSSADGFHAIHDAVRKRYRYVLHDGARARRLPAPLCLASSPAIGREAMHRAAQALCGTHDFSSFETTGSARAIRACAPSTKLRSREAGGDADRIVLEVEADGFLYNMVRTIVGTLVEIGRGVRGEAWPAEVLTARDRRAAGQTAPPQGLFLVASGLCLTASKYMRIAHLITRLILGGAQENTVLNCEDLLRDYGDDVLLITGPPLRPEGSLLDRARAARIPDGDRSIAATSDSSLARLGQSAPHS